MKNTLKHLILFLLILITAIPTYARKISNDIIWKVSVISNYEKDADKITDFTYTKFKIKQTPTRFYWGDKTYFEIKSRSKKVVGFDFYTTYEVVDKYGQKGQIILQQLDSKKNPYKYVFHVQFDGISTCKMFCVTPNKRI